MKGKLKRGCTIGMIAAFLLPGLTGENLFASNQGGEPIIIRHNPADPIGAPRAPEVIPFFAELLNGYVILGASAPCGTVSVSLTSTAGDSYSTSFDTTDGAILLPVSGDAGFYTIRITTSAGVQYVGEFTI